MSELSKKKLRIKRRSLRTRAHIRSSATAERMRLSVFRSTKHIYAQIIDDVAQKTVASFSSLLMSESFSGNKSAMARKVGLEVARLAKNVGVESVTFDRGPFLYHGRIKELAEGVREGGLKF